MNNCSLELLHIMFLRNMLRKIRNPVCVYTNKLGVYQSLVDLSVLDYVSHFQSLPLNLLPSLQLQDLNELLAMCSTQQWSERRDGIAQLHLLLESSRPFTLVPHMSVVVLLHS